MLSGACCLAGNRSLMHGRYRRVETGEKMRLGSPRSATSALDDNEVRLFNPAVVLGMVATLGAGTAGRLLGTGTWTESGNFSVSHRKYLDAHGRITWCEPGRRAVGTTTVLLGGELIIFSSTGTKVS